MTVKKHILTLIIAITLPFATKAQTFVDGSVGYIPFAVSTASDGNVSTGIALNLQYGKFVNNYKMRSVTFSMRSVPVLRDDVTISPPNGMGTDYKIAITSKATTFCLGYERKVTFGYTEFDDQWQFYNIINYYLSITNISESYSKPGIPDNKKEAGTYFNPDIGIGLGMARKFQQKAYGYIDLRFYGPILGEGIGGYIDIGTSINFGVRYFLR